MLSYQAYFRLPFVLKTLVLRNTTPQIKGADDGRELDCRDFRLETHIFSIYFFLWYTIGQLWTFMRRHLPNKNSRFYYNSSIFCSCFIPLWTFSCLSSFSFSLHIVKTTLAFHRLTPRFSMENTDHILKDAIKEHQDVKSFAHRSYYMPSTRPPLRFYRHHIVEGELPDASDDTEISTGASSSGYVKIAPRTTTFDPSVVTLPADSRGVTRAAILKRNYRSRPGVRDRERETERARKNKKSENRS